MQIVTRGKIVPEIAAFVASTAGTVALALMGLAAFLKSLATLLNSIATIRTSLRNAVPSRAGDHHRRRDSSSNVPATSGTSKNVRREILRITYPSLLLFGFA